MIAAGVVAAVLLVVIGVFQLALALGAPWGQAAWGGQHTGKLPFRFRVASGIAAFLVYPLMAAVVLVAAGLIDVVWLPASPVLMWGLSGFFLLGTVANLASRSRPERVWGPVSLTISVCCAVIASGV